jgi:hypothetical protein
VKPAATNGCAADHAASIPAPSDIRSRRIRLSVSLPVVNQLHGKKRSQLLCGAGRGATTASSVVSNKPFLPPAAPVPVAAASVASNNANAPAAPLAVTPPGANSAALSVQAAPFAPIASNAIKAREVTRTIVRSSIKTESTPRCEKPRVAHCCETPCRKPCNAKCATTASVCHPACNARSKTDCCKKIEVKLEVKVCRCERRRFLRHRFCS